MTSNMTLFPGNIKATGIFYTVIMVPHDTLWNRATIDITNFDIIWSNVICSFVRKLQSSQILKSSIEMHINLAEVSKFGTTTFLSLICKMLKSDKSQKKVSMFTAFLETKCIGST